MALKNITKKQFEDYVILAAEKDEMYDENNLHQYCLREYDSKIIDIYLKNLTSLEEISKETTGTEQMSACSAILILAPTPENADLYNDFVEKVWKQNKEFPIRIPDPGDLKVQVSYTFDHFLCLVF